MLRIKTTRRYKTPAFATEERQERLRSYYLGLGRFVDMFAMVEVAIQMALWHYAKTPYTIARAVFGSLRVDSAVAAIRRLIEVRGDIDPVLIEDIRDICQQLILINKVRNDILY